MIRLFVRNLAKGVPDESHEGDRFVAIFFLMVIGALISGVCLALRKPDNSLPKLIAEALLVAIVCGMICVFVIGVIVSCSVPQF